MGYPCAKVTLASGLKLTLVYPSGSTLPVSSCVTFFVTSKIFPRFEIKLEVLYGKHKPSPQAFSPLLGKHVEFTKTRENIIIVCTM